MNISKEEIERVKRSSDIISIIESYGVSLKRRGRCFVGLCPLHEEKNPSFTVDPDKKLWKCFGCSEGGDVIGFVSKIEGVGFREAFEKLGGNGKGAEVKRPVPEDHELTPSRIKLLGRVMGFYRAQWGKDSSGIAYLASRGINDKEALDDFGVGLSNGKLMNALPKELQVLSDLKALGVINSRGKEHLHGCVVFPLYDTEGNVVNLYGRRTQDSEVNHLYLPGSRRGLVNRSAAKRSKTLILTESIIDALSFYTNGFKNVIPLYGINGLTQDHINLFKNTGTEEVYIVFDSDDSGKTGAKRLEEELSSLGIKTHIVSLPEKDVNEFFLKGHSVSEMEKLLSDSLILRSEASVKREETLFEKIPDGFRVGYGGRLYEIKPIQGRGCKAVVKCARDLSSTKDFVLSQVDLFQLPSRERFVRAVSQLLKEKDTFIREDMNRILDRVTKGEPQEEKAPEPSEADKERAQMFLKNPDLFTELLSDFETLGLTGEETNKTLGYLVATSRKLDEPLSMVVQSRSAAGKSALQEAILMLIPTEDVVKYTRITDQALFYKDKDSLSHKILALEESTGMGGAAYSIRVLQSAKTISIASTAKDPQTGKMMTIEYRVLGPLVLLITTTQTSLEGEMSTRCLFTTVDESKEMTERILVKQRERATLQGMMEALKAEIVILKHQVAQRMLRPLKVINNLAPGLTFPTDTLRARRDNQKYLSLISAICFLRQFQKEVKTVEMNGSRVEYIEVEESDIALADKLSLYAFGHTLSELHPASRKLLKLIWEMLTKMSSEQGIAPGEVAFTRRDVREWTKWSDFQVRDHIRQLEDLEYLHSKQGKRGKEYTYVMRYRGEGCEGERFILGLTNYELEKRNYEPSTRLNELEV